MKGDDLKDEDIVGKGAYLDERRIGTVHDFYLGLANPEIIGIIISRGWRSRPIKGGKFTFDGKRYSVQPGAADEGWKPVRGSAIKYSRVKGKEIFAGPGWKIGRLNHLLIDVDNWLVAGIDAEIEHQLIMKNVGDYQKLHENTSIYSIKHFYANAYTLNPGKLAREYGDSDKARFLTDSGDSTIRGLGEASSMIVFPPAGMSIHESGTITLPIDAGAVEEIAIRMVNQGAMGTAEGRKNILRKVFEEYYRRAG